VHSQLGGHRNVIHTSVARLGCEIRPNDADSTVHANVDVA
jgi:hypothetical protein